jgi:hypothetical protein
MSIEYSDEMADAICLAIASGESLRSICRWYGMPNISAVMRWIARNEHFETQYYLAREAQAELLADDTVDLSDAPEPSQKYYQGKPVFDEAGNPVMEITNAAIQHRKLQVDARKWKAARMNTKRWGDKVQTDITSGGKPIKNEWHLHPVKVAASGDD